MERKEILKIIFHFFVDLKSESILEGIRLTLAGKTTESIHSEIEKLEKGFELLQRIVRVGNIVGGCSS